ncbi:TetR/AcrR family transcriptional regulator C-terminal domain-containing protein [Lacticaseibacillus thailandensis]|nr:TetR/AcrR family transcriptional regulator C-terminal domain-containing protein [Lacticaseibacillus thailandensis]
MMPKQMKQVLADGLEQMLTEMPLSKVRVVTLCQRCGVTPPTFYYYFHDKYEVVAWVFMGDFTQAFADKAPAYSVTRIKQVLTIMARHRDFYRAAYAENGQNDINSYIQAFNVDLAANACRAAGIPFDNQRQLAVTYHSYGMMGLFVEWLRGDGQFELNDLASFQFQHTPAFLSQALQQYAFSSQQLLQ